MYNWAKHSLVARGTSRDDLSEFRGTRSVLGQSTLGSPDGEQGANNKADGYQVKIGAFLAVSHSSLA
jgi:hypothetical protein